MCCEEGVRCVLPFIFQFQCLHLDCIDFKNAVCDVCLLVGICTCTICHMFKFHFSDKIYFTLTLVFIYSR